MAKQLNNKVYIQQAGKELAFRLSDKELQNLRNSSIYTAPEKERAMKATFGRCYNFSMYAFFEYETTPAKYKRFANNFNYHKGDFTWFIISEEFDKLKFN